jgi:hypothetical protein
MLNFSISDSATRELGALHDALSRYHEVSGRDVTATVAKKTDDIRIELLRGYWERRMKGSRKGAKNFQGVAFREMRQRGKAGEGITLRPGLTASSSAPMEYFQRRTLRGAHGTRRRLMVPVRMSGYQRAVWTELARRQAGVGVLGVAFLMPRRRANAVPSAPEVQTRQSHSRETIGRMTVAPMLGRLEGFVPGQAKVGARHSILSIALRNVRADTEVYLARKTAATAAAEFKAAGVRLR